MQHFHYTEKVRWDEAVRFLTAYYEVVAPLDRWGSIDYHRIRREDARRIVYNRPRPSTPLKTFFLPIKENVSTASDPSPRILMGVPNCDLAGLALLDKIYLDGEFSDPFYKNRRKNTIIVATGCHDTAAHCHCTSYGVQPFPEAYFDLELAVLDDKVVLKSNSDAGAELVKRIESFIEEEPAGSHLMKAREEKRNTVVEQLAQNNAGLPDYRHTGDLVRQAAKTVWKKYAQGCVSCGACTASCPTCTCFLLSDRPGFEKVRSVDACQYPGFERVAAGEDPLKQLTSRFKNRYMCKYVWKSDRFDAQACTGCGRCIDACIGNINKNEMFMELVETELIPSDGE